MHAIAIAASLEIEQADEIEQAEHMPMPIAMDDDNHFSTSP